MKSPKKILLGIFKSFLRSLTYICAHSLAASAPFCTAGKYFSSRERTVLSMWLTILPFTASVLWESPSRTGETVLFVLPKFIDFTWNYFTKKKMVKDVPGFLQAVFAVSIGTVCSYYISDKDSMKSKYQTVGRLMVGDDKKCEKIKVGREKAKKEGSENEMLMEK